jgi:hypothetical protein
MYLSYPAHDKMHSMIFKHLAVLAMLVVLTLSSSLSNLATEGNLSLLSDDEPTWLDLFEFARNFITPCEYPPDPEELEAKAINLTGLTPECAKTIWCRYRMYKKQRTWENSTLTAVLWPDIKRAKAEKLFDSPILNGTLFNENEDSMWDGQWIHTYAGQWSFEQTCYLLKQKVVGRLIGVTFSANLVDSRYSFLSSIPLLLNSACHCLEILRAEYS